MKCSYSIFILILFCLLFSDTQPAVSSAKLKTIALKTLNSIKNNKLYAGIGAVLCIGYCRNVYQCRDENFWTKWRLIEKQKKDSPKWLLNPTRIEFKNILNALFAIVNSSYNQILLSSILNPYYFQKLESNNDLCNLLTKNWSNALNCLKFFNIEEKDTEKIRYIYDTYKWVIASDHSYTNLDNFVRHAELNVNVESKKDENASNKASQESINKVKQKLEKAILDDKEGLTKIYNSLLPVNMKYEFITTTLDEEGLKKIHNNLLPKNMK